MNETALIWYLRQHRLLSGDNPRISPLSGGVSSDIVLVETDGERLVVKCALEKLRVKDDWKCDTARNITEYNAIRYAGRILSDSVPKVLHFDQERRLFVMEFLGSEFTPWKSQLLTGRCDPSIAVQTATLLAALHAKSWMDDEAKSTFNTGDAFFELRVSPYLITTGKRHPDLSALFEAEAERLLGTRLALVHGDWSAKNILVSSQRIVVLDWEVAWFGDPAFDSAFFLALLHLKAIHNRPHAADYFDLMQAFRTTYAERLPQFEEDLRRRIGRLTLMLMLARIDGKSPAEYITSDDTKNRVRKFARALLMEGAEDPDEIRRRWQKAIETA